MSRGIRKYIRREKARIRRETADADKQAELIKALYQQVSSASEQQGEAS